MSGEYWHYKNENPQNKRVGDCVIRAISTALNQPWELTYLDLCIQGYIDCDIPSANHVWGNYLKKRGFRRQLVMSECPECYTVENFCKEHKEGCYILAIHSHVVTVIDGMYIDSFDSGNEIPIYFWEKGD